VLGLALSACALWLIIALLPWRPWATSESLDAPALNERHAFSDTTILIPARNEADVIAPTLAAAAEQGKRVQIVLVDDRSIDDTVSNAQPMTWTSALRHWLGRGAIWKGRSYIKL